MSFEPAAIREPEEILARPDRAVEPVLVEAALARETVAPGDSVGAGETVGACGPLAGRGREEKRSRRERG